MTPQGKLTFFCPVCREKLSFLDGTIIKLRGRLHATTFSCDTMFYFAAALGTHGCIVGEGVKVFPGARIEFECANPACRHNFTTEKNAELAEIACTDESGVDFKVAFSKVFGKDATFVLDVQRKELVQTFGGSADEILHDPNDKMHSFFGDLEKR